MGVTRNGPRGSTRPRFALAATEPFRALADLARLPLYRQRLGRAPRGDGHAVLVLPGFATGDLSTAPLRRCLDRLGYRSEGWGLGCNLGHYVIGEDGERLRARLVEMYRRSGGRVSLIGWSLGGVMARRLARDDPDMVRQVIMLGSPFTGDPAAVTIRSLFERISGERMTRPSGMRRFWRDRLPTGVPTCAIYTRSDGITAWQNCVEAEGPLTTNVEVEGSHSGLAVNPRVMLVIAGRLALSEQMLRRSRA